MKLSVIIPFYNSGDTLEQAVMPFMGECGYDAEIILVDDQSTDDGLEIAQELAARDPKIRILRNDKKGVSSARNLGLAKATGDAVMFVDSDDYMDAEPIAGLLELLDADTDLVSFGYTRHHVDSEGETLTPLPVEAGEWESADAYLRYFLYPRNRTSIWCKLYRMEVIRRGRIEFDPELAAYEDVVFVIKYLKACRGRIKHSTVCAYHYYTREASYTKERFLNRSMDIFPAFEKVFKECGDQYRSGAELYYTELLAMTIRRLILLHGYKTPEYERLRSELLKYRSSYRKSCLPTRFLKCFVAAVIYTPHLVGLANRFYIGGRKK